MVNFNIQSIASDLFANTLRSLAIFTFTLIVAACVSAQAPFFDDAFANAAKPGVRGGSSWVITATVSLNGYASGKEYITARGPVTLQSDGMLGGDLPLSINKSAVANNTISIYIRPSNPAVVVLNRLIAGKPMLGRRAITVSLPVNPNFNYLAGPIKWSDGDREIRIDLESQFVKNPSPPSGGGNSGKPIGARYKITGHVNISNAEDGVGDNTCEIIGWVNLLRVRNAKGEKVSEVAKQLFVIIPQDVIKGMDFKFPNNLFFDVYDDDQSQYRIGGHFSDSDIGVSASDKMWPDPNDAMRFDFRRLAGTGETNYPGDRDSENAEVYITVTKISDLYKKP